MDKSVTPSVPDGNHGAIVVGKRKMDMVARIAVFAFDDVNIPKRAVVTSAAQSGEEGAEGFPDGAEIGWQMGVVERQRIQPPRVSEQR